MGEGGRQALAARAGREARAVDSDVEHDRRRPADLAVVAAALEVPIEELARLDRGLSRDLARWLEAHPEARAPAGGDEGGVQMPALPGERR